MFSELYIHLEGLVLLPSQRIREEVVFFLFHVKIMTHFRTHDPFFLSTVNVQHLKKTHHLVAVFCNFQHQTLTKDLPQLTMLAAVGCRLLLLADKTETEGVCTYVSVLREQW